MIAVHLTREFLVHGEEHLEAHTERVMEHLLALESETVRDADVAGSLTDGVVQVSVYAIGESFDDASEVADSVIRAAIHAAGGATPNWEPVQKLVDLVDA